MRFKQYLYIVLGVHLILSILFMFVSFMEGLFELIAVAILYCAAAQMSYCQLIIYMIISANKLIHFFCMIGLIIQRGMFGAVFSHSEMSFLIVMMMVFIVFYIGAITVCFYAYREFKGMMFDNGMVSPGGLNNLLPFNPNG